MTTADAAPEVWPEPSGAGSYPSTTLRMTPAKALSIVWVLALSACSVPMQEHVQSYAYVNGNWFDGERFVPRVAYVSDGVFVAEAPAQITSVVDLNGGYVIPPFAEAHNHNLDTDYGLEERIRQYLNDGVFYAKMQSSIKRRIEPNRHLFNHPRTIDVAFAHAPLTATGGHPIALRERFFEMGRFDGLFGSKAAIEGEGYVIIDSLQDLDEKWAGVLALEPDFIKVNLIHSEEFALRREDPTYFGDKGLNPALLSAIVERAHETGLRVSAHVDTPADFHAAVVAGVDEINHLPSRDAETMERIREEDARSAAEQGIVVVTTVSLVTRRVDPADERLDAVWATVSDNLDLLNRHGVPLAVGSDMFNDTSLDEAVHLRRLDVLSNLDLLQMWTETSAQTIFPKRNIGRLEVGFEASFLVLRGDPIEDFDAVTDIAMRVKQGIDLADVLDVNAE
ncbi:amidohydrolase family protein [Rubrivirga sp. IMCC43871]|uniref:amidohydrolase family protein n=1 Tax=Rubrivirga sp. IMCC43871 TaxID=3391575 RepID=UPI00398FD0AA